MKKDNKMFKMALYIQHRYFGDLFVCFVALRPKSISMAMAGQSVYLTTLFSWANFNKRLTSSFMHNTFTLTDNKPSCINQQKEGE